MADDRIWIWKRIALFAVLVLGMAGCTEVEPSLTQSSVIGIEAPLFTNKADQISVIATDANKGIEVGGVCNTRITALQWSFDRGSSWSTIQRDNANLKNTSDLDCSNGTFSIGIVDVTAAGIFGVQKSEDLTLLIRGYSSDLGAGAQSTVTVRYRLIPNIIEVSVPSVTTANASTPVTWTVTFSEKVTVSTDPNKIGWTGDFQSCNSFSISQSETPSATATITASGCSGDGTFEMSSLSEGFASNGVDSRQWNPATYYAVDVVNPPTVTSVTGPAVALGNSTASFVWTVTFSENVQGLDSSKVVLTGTATSGCTVDLVQGSPITTITVAVTGCTGNGTVGIASLNSGIVQDGALNASFAWSAGSSLATVDNNQPAITSVTGPAITSGNSTTSFVWTIAYSENVIVNNDATLITLGGTSISDCSKTIAQGTPNSAIVTVTGCIGTGTVNIPSLSSNTASDGASNPAQSWNGGSSSASFSPIIIEFAEDFSLVQDSVTSQSAGITLSQAPATDLEIAYIVGGNALSGVDYVGINNYGIVTIPAGQTSANLDFSLLANSDVNVEKQLIFSLQGAANKSGIVLGPKKQHHYWVDHGSTSTAPLKISTGHYHTCGITGANTLKCWGYNTSGELGDGTLINRSVPVTIDAGTDYRSVATGGYHTCGITTGGVLKCWGKNTSGELGDGTSINRSTPVTIDAGTNYTFVATGGSHTCGITTGGVLKCWGKNTSGQVGNGTSNNIQQTPEIIDSLNNYTTISAGFGHTCGITTGGVLKCWGDNTNGQIGDSTLTSRSAPVTIDSGTGYSAIAAGGAFTCGIAAGSLKCWGDDSYGQLGNGTGPTQTSPTQIDSGTNYKAIAAGYWHACGITSTDAVRCWGDNARGKLGDGTNAQRTSPTAIATGSTFSAIAAGNYHTCGITGGLLKCWGLNDLGPLGNGEITSQLSPVSTDVNNTYLYISTGQQHTCGITTEGTVMCWGANYSNQLGDGSDIEMRISPLTVDAGIKYLAVSSGDLHTCGITSSTRTLKCWGWNLYGQLGDGTNIGKKFPVIIDAGTPYSAVSASAYHTCGITTGGVLKCWGDNTHGQVNGTSTPGQILSPVPVDSDNRYSAVSVGWYHSCGITAADNSAEKNKIKCWGRNIWGEMLDGDSLTPSLPYPRQIIDSGTDYLTLAAGDRHTCGITTGGFLKCWGYNNGGQLGDGTAGETFRNSPYTVGTDTYTAVSGGQSQTCAITTGGTLRCWGSNSTGQLGDGTLTSRYSPTTIDVSTLYSAISASSYHTCGIAASTPQGPIKCWGSNSSGRLGVLSRGLLPNLVPGMRR